MLKPCSVDEYFHNAPVDLHHNFWPADLSLKSTSLENLEQLKSLASPMCFLVLDFDHFLEILSNIHIFQ